MLQQAVRRRAGGIPADGLLVMAAAVNAADIGHDARDVVSLAPRRH
jgi:hypothetical protein